jgi:hypothetical protein
LCCKPYRLQLARALSDGDKETLHVLCGEIFDKMENEDDYLNKTATFHLCDKVNRHNVRIWSTENPQ